MVIQFNVTELELLDEVEKAINPADSTEIQLVRILKQYFEAREKVQGSTCNKATTTQTTTKRVYSSAAKKNGLWPEED